MSVRRRRAAAASPETGKPTSASNGSGPAERVDTELDQNLDADLDADLFDADLLREQLDGGAVEIPIHDALDLHPFRPQEISDVVREYLDVAFERGFRELRIIHGRGIGVQRQTVRTILEHDSRVLRFSDAPSDAGGWGATLVWLSIAGTAG